MAEHGGLWDSLWATLESARGEAGVGGASCGTGVEDEVMALNVETAIILYMKRSVDRPGETLGGEQVWREAARRQRRAVQLGRMLREGGGGRRM